MGFDTAYEAITEESGDQRWAFGTGFADPLEGIDTSVPAGLDPAALARYCLALGDDALIYSHRLQQWVTRLPELEEETAIANIALDLLGQARMLLARAGTILGRTEDELAFFRPEQDFRNVRLAEHEDRDFAELAGRLLIFSTWRLALFQELSAAPDPVLAAIAAKGVKELTYHRDYAAQWVIRLGDGTGLSHERMQRALTALWPLVGELFRPDRDALANVEPIVIDTVLDSVLSPGGLDRPDVPALAGVSDPAGRDGVHTEAMGHVLAELQSLARAYPDAAW
jgi:ring-1,2-phenylacetyl-CoA epoxidase subunit PaaC